MLSNQQIETFIYSFRATIEALQAQQAIQNAALNQIQTTLNALNTTAASQGGSVTRLNLAAAIAGILGVANGGTGGKTAAAARASLGAAALPQTILGSNFTTPNVNAVAGGSQSFTVNGSSFIAPAGGGACTGSVSFTINGSNFTIIFSGAPNTGSQALV